MTDTLSASSSHYDVDLLVVGGGINGVGIARDAAGRGLKVLLCEQKDLASATSSASSKLIHGGLRYLENYEFRLVREALSERDVLLNNAPHIVHPLRFVLPHNRSLRPAWMIRIGMFLYDNLAKRSARLPGSRKLSLRSMAQGLPLKADIATGFEYSDARVDDSRLVVLNAMDARERGATILTRTACVGLEKDEGQWLARLRAQDGAEITARARILVNAAGPWVEKLQHLAAPSKPATTSKLRLVKGSHFTIPRLYEGDWAYILQNPDGRIVFVIPYQDHLSLIGTTDVIYGDDPAKVAISQEEIDYLCKTINGYFTKQTTPADITWSYAGVRPLYDDQAGNASAVTRDYVFDVSGGKDGEPPLLSIFGGKITTYRRLAEHALEKLEPFTQKSVAWTAHAPLPGGDMPAADPNAYARQFASRHPWLPESLALRYVNAYGTLTERMLQGAAQMADLGEDFGSGLFEREVQWLVEQEWAHSAEDILWRRTRLGLSAHADTAARLDAWLTQH
ncbi:MAG: glycerol-3-phosphate dehydrogenase [Burkholderiaceae bacterium]|nr:glycerol-3-phosphate dehydrogenase [Burkholderiaceae bacterium]